MRKVLSSLGLSLLCAVPSWADEAASADKQGGGSQTFIVLAMALVLFYFILWRPEQKRRKLVEKQRSSMKVGDKVTAMGIVGIVDRMPETGGTVILKMFDGSKIEVLRACITDVQSPSAEDSSS
ncbi:MAG: preprotein translocase subunit YajC [Chlamydiae bacterium]|nr:preprotein translocase subunit YajC [Chlamydiota bacterium]